MSHTDGVSKPMLNLDVLPGGASWKGAEHVFYGSCCLVKRSYTQDISRFGSGMSLDMTLHDGENFIINNHFMWVKWVVK